MKVVQINMTGKYQAVTSLAGDRKHTTVTSKTTTAPFMTHNKLMTQGNIFKTECCSLAKLRCGYINYVLQQMLYFKC